MKRNLIVIAILSLFVIAGMAQAQDTKDDVHLFQNFFRDAGITKMPYGEGGIIYSDYDAFSSFEIPLRGGYNVNEQIEVNASIGYLSWSPEVGDGESGISDLYVGGRYNFVPGPTKISAGGYATLPIGEEKVGQEKLNFGAFGAVRHPLDNGMIITGTLGLDFIETVKYTSASDDFDFDDFDPANFDPEDFESSTEVKEETEYENSLILGAGAIYPMNEQLNIVGELVIKTEVDYMALSAGADYKLEMGSRVRGALMLGLDDGAPDLAIMASFLHFF